MSIDVNRLTKRFGSFVALDDVSFTVGQGELLALLGPSGSGKTTLLRIIAGLEHADSGSVLFDGNDAARRDARDRGVGFVFQHSRPHELDISRSDEGGGAVGHRDGRADGRCGGEDRGQRR